MLHVPLVHLWRSRRSRSVLAALLVVALFLALFSSRSALAAVFATLSEATAGNPISAYTQPGGIPPAAPAEEPVPAGETTAAGRTAAYRVNDPTAYVYTVRQAESWRGIARKFDVGFAELRQANQALWNLRGETIRPGDEMAIPGRTAGQMPSPLRYTVEAGDSWHKIAHRFGVSYWDLRLDNPDLWRRRGIYIQPGDELTILGANVAYAAPAMAVETEPEDVAVVAETEPAAATEGVSVAVPAPASEDGTTPPATQINAPILVTNPPEGAEVYTIRPGDTWYSIAARFGVTFADLRSANPTLWAQRGQTIHVGDQMAIPAHGTPPPPPEIRTAPGEREAPIEAEIETEEIETEEIETEEIETEEIEAEEAVQESAPEAVELMEPAESAEPADAAVSEPERVRVIGVDVRTGDRTYRVAPGETWESVAERFDVTVVALRAVNPELAGRDLVEGDVIRLP